MAYFWQEEEDLVPNLQDLNIDLQDIDISSLDVPGLAGGSDSLGYSYDQFKESLGTTMSQYLPQMGFDVPKWAQQYGQRIRQEGEAGTAMYTPEYTGEITDQDIEDVLPYVAEKVAEGATANASILFGTGLASLLMKGPGPSKIAGGAVALGTIGLNWALQVDEAVKTHADVAGKKPENMNMKDMANAGWTAAENAAIDLVNPVRWTKFLRQQNLPPNLSLKELEKKLNTTERDSIGMILFTTGKEMAKESLAEGTTELAQYANIMRTSEKGIAGIEGPAAATSFVVGGAAGGVMSAPSSVSIARAPNLQRDLEANLLEYANTERLMQATEEYEDIVAGYEKTYREIVDSFQGPVQEGKKPSIIPKEQFLEEQYIQDVVPDLFKVPEKKLTTLNLLGRKLYKMTLGKSIDPYENKLTKPRTGKQMSNMLNIVRSLGPVETASGKEQTKLSFDNLRRINISEFVIPFENLRNKWTSYKPFTGEMGARVRPIINKYLSAKLEEFNENPIYNLKEVRAEIESVMDAAALAELDADIQQIADIQEKVWKRIAKALKVDEQEIGYIKGYLTRGYDFNKAEANPEGFKQSLINDMGLSEPEAEAVLQKVLNRDDPNIMTSEEIRAQKKRVQGMGRQSYEKSRTLRWDKLAPEFRSEDTLQTIENYLMSISTRIASIEAFGGDRGNKINKWINELKQDGLLNDAETDELWGLYDALHHMYKKPRTEEDRALVQGMKGLSTVTAINYLGLATISSLTEPMWIGQRVGFANMLKSLPALAGQVLVGIRRSIYSGKEGETMPSNYGRDILRVLGFAVNPAMSDKVDKLYAGDRNVYLNLAFRSPALLWLTQYTNFVRVWGAVAGHNFIKEQYAKLISGKLSKGKLALLKQELKENGLTLEDFRKVGALDDGKFDILNDAYLEQTIVNSRGNTIRVRDILVPWMDKVVTDVALEPTATNRPLWMSDPKMLLFAQLKSFPILFGNTVARRINKKMNPVVCTPDIIGTLGAVSAISGALALAAMSLALKDEIKGNEIERGPIDVLGGVGLPLVDVASVSGYVGGPWTSLVEQFRGKAFGDAPIADTSEMMFDIMLKATLGSLGQQAINPKE